MAWYDALAGVGDFAAKLFNTGYSLYEDQRDFQYQKDLQNQIFAREDNAVRRRMADLEAAGLNPNLAAGSAAGAGSVVSRSNSKNVELGSALDTISAVNKIKLERQEVENKKKEGQILDTQKNIQEQDLFTNQYLTALNLGFDVSPWFDMDTQKMYWQLNTDKNAKVDGYDQYFPRFKPTFQLQNELNRQNMVNSASMLQLDTDFYESNKWLKAILPVLNILAQGGGTAANFIKAFK